MLLEMWGLTTSQLAMAARATSWARLKTPKIRGSTWALMLTRLPPPLVPCLSPGQGGFDQIRVSPRTAPLSGRAKIPHSIQITQFEGCQSCVAYSRRPNQNGTAREDDEAEQREQSSVCSSFPGGCTRDRGGGSAGPLWAGWETGA